MRDATRVSPLHRGSSGWIGHGRGRAALALLLALSATAARAQGAPPQPGPQPAPPADPGAALETERQHLRGVESAITLSDEQRHRITADIEAIRTDRVRLAAALLDTTARVRDAETKVAGAENRLDTMRGSEDAIRQSLDSRRGVIAEVLASLQRMGRRPPPAILVGPDDILKSIRTSMLLGDVVPQLRGEAEALASDLGDLRRLRDQIGDEKNRLALELAGLGAERARLDGLIAARQADQQAAETALTGEQGRGADLARQAVSLKDLIAGMEAEVASAERAAEAARSADQARQRQAQAEADDVRDRSAADAFRDPARLSPAIGFASARAMLELPAVGRLVKDFGSADEFGGTAKGLSLATRPGAVVSSPCDGWVAFSGPYRSYGQLAIINAGDGYYVVLAGLGRIDLAPGRFVLAGEPIGAMGDGAGGTAAAIALGATDPILYVEFRKDGTAIDPDPWWAKAELEKVRG